MNFLFASLSMHYRSRLREIVLFVGIGVLNTLLDFAVLNLLIALTHHDRGGWLLVFNGLSFLAAVLNSYVLNGRFTFRSSGPTNLQKFLPFVAVNAVGLLLNSVTVWAMSPLLDHVLATIVAINVSKAVATLVSLCWNYYAIKRWVFRTERPTISAISAELTLTNEEIKLS